MRGLSEKHREFLAYLAFGVITVAVGLSVYLAVFDAAGRWFHIPLANKTTSAYTVVYVLAQVIKWIVTVVSTFFLHRKWVFHSHGPIRKQFFIFCSSRLVTFFLDLAATYGFIQLFALWLCSESLPALGGIRLSIELWAKLIVAILVIILNYIISKLIIFKKQPV